MPTQAEKAQAFRALHARPCAFIIPNPWDIGSARILAHLGFEALATTSMGQAFALGRQDNSLDRAETLAYASLIVSRTNLPVSARMVLEMTRKPSRKRFGLRRLPELSALPSKMQPGAQTIRSMKSNGRLNAYRRPRKRRAPFPFLSR